MTINVHSYESMGTFDGPGLRLVVFLQGCNFRCLYCANPDTIAGKGGTPTPPEEIVRMAMSQRPFFGKRGGVTFSGGEPTFQAKALVPLVRELKEKGIHVCIDSNGGIWNEEVEELFKLTDLVLLDIMLPDIDGLEILKRMKSDFELCNIPVIMVTAKSSEIDKVKGLDQGADDYMTKPFGVMELISRVKAILRRSRNTSDEKIFKAGDIIINEERHAVYVNDEPVELTFKEYNLLKLLISNYGIVMSREVIMDRIWGTSFEGESRTLDMHIKTLRKKLGESGSMIKTVRNVGYAIGLD